ncbi:MAG: acyl carrier protein [Firmicutes bacterium]|nr:acyl carrier protein [Bacillota bacterium]
MREKILEILEDLIPDEEIEGRTGLVEDRILSSFTILNLISEIYDELDIEIPVEDVVPENFDSLDAIVAVVEKYQQV